MSMACRLAQQVDAKRPQAWLAAALLLVGFGTATCAADEPLTRRFDEVVQPFVKTYCLAGHGSKKPQAKLDLSGWTSIATVVKSERIWDKVLQRLEAEEMPPEDAARRPTAHERRAVLDWLREFREQEAR